MVLGVCHLHPQLRHHRTHLSENSVEVRLADLLAGCWIWLVIIIIIIILIITQYSVEVRVTGLLAGCWICCFRTLQSALSILNLPYLISDR